MRPDVTRLSHTAKDFITALAAQHHFDSHGFDLATEKVHGRACTHGRHVIRLEMVNDVRNGIEAFLHGKDELVVKGSKKVCHFLCRQMIGRVFQSDGERVQLGPSGKHCCSADPSTWVCSSWAGRTAHLGRSVRPMWAWTHRWSPWLACACAPRTVPGRSFPSLVQQWQRSSCCPSRHSTGPHKAPRTSAAFGRLFRGLREATCSLPGW